MSEATPIASSSGQPQSWRRSPDALSRQLGGAMVVVHLGTNQMYELNRTAARAWELLEEDGCQRRITERLESEFEIHGTVLERDLAQLLGSLSRSQLIVPA